MSIDIIDMLGYIHSAIEAAISYAHPHPESAM
jgi:hypothetical protein